MSSRPKPAQPRPQPRLYLVTPPLADAAEFADTLTGALAAADIAAVLLRLENADERTLINQIKALAKLVQDRGAALLLDGHAGLVARSGADGAHLSGIAEFSAALDLLKPERVAGVGALASRHDAMVAAESGADYLMYGDSRDRGREIAAVLEQVRWSSELFELPCIAFAENLDEVAPLVAAGADFIAADFMWQDPRGAAASVSEAAERARLPEAVA